MSFLIANPFIKSTPPPPREPSPPPFSLEEVQASWSDPPRFEGKRKVDPAVSTWLASVADGCRTRNVPRKHWPEVARALMGEKALLRLIEFERVLASMEGNELPPSPTKDITKAGPPGPTYEWTWERFEVAVSSMGWEVSGKKIRAFTIAAKKCGRWWVVGKKADSPPSGSNDVVGVISPSLPAPPADPPTAKKSIFGGHAKFVSEPASSLRESPASDDDEPEKAPSVKASTVKVRRTPIRAMSDSLTSVFRPGPKPSMDSDISQWEDVSISFSTISDNKAAAPSQPPASSSSQESSSALVPSPPVMPPAPRRTQTDAIQTTVTHAPDWLVGAVGALDFLTSNHPRAMSALSAVLLTVGSVPVMAATGGAAAAFPALAATAGGHAVLGVLGSASAQAVGAVAIGLGNWVKAMNEGSVQVAR